MKKPILKRSPSIYSPKQVTTLEGYCKKHCLKFNECGAFKKHLMCDKSSLYTRMDIEFSAVIEGLNKYIQKQQKDFTRQIENFNKEIKRLTDEM